LKSPGTPIEHDLVDDLVDVRMKNPTLPIIRASLEDTTEDPRVAKPAVGSAAVALILAGPDTDLSLSFIRRADRVGDPWSGHMAFPGGRAGILDQSHPAVAERETMEEVGIRLDPLDFIGPLPQIAVRRGRIDTGIMLSSFVYYVGEALVQFSPNHEVAAAYWIPLSHLWEPDNFTTLTIASGVAPADYPAISYQGNLIWGLSYRVLQQFAQAIGFPLPDSVRSKDHGSS
jgi:8-oxo-dGTP pyrophosphatase MutT (NUDIX family)